jgi:DNA-binding response OmpR family regulator
MSRHILIVDDDALLRRSLAFNLEKVGYHVSTATTAEDALAQVRLDPPDLVLLDIGLPGMDGLDALRSLRQQIERTKRRTCGMLINEQRGVNGCN